MLFGLTKNHFFFLEIKLKSTIKCFQNKGKQNTLWKKLRQVVLTVVGFNRPTIKLIKEEVICKQLIPTKFFNRMI